MLAECRYLAGDVQGALAVLDVAAAHAVDNRDRGAVEASRATFYIYANDLGSATRCVRHAAGLLGCPVPEDRDALAEAVRATIAEIVAVIGDRRIEDLIDLPVMSDRDSLALMELFSNCMPAAFQREPALGAYVTAQMVRRSLEHGNCSLSTHAYCAFTRVLLDTDHRHLAFRFGQLGVALNRRLDDRALRPTIDFVFALFTMPWLGPLEEAAAFMRDAARLGREVGDHIHAGYAAAHEISYRAFRGAEPLEDIAHDARVYRQQCREVADEPSARYLGWQIDRLRVLAGEIETLGAEGSDPVASGVANASQANRAHQFNFLVMLVELTYSFGDHRAALDLATAARRFERAAPNALVVTEHRFYGCLAALASCRADPARRAELAPAIDTGLHELQRSAAACPANFEARALLVEAERAAQGSEIAPAMELYDRAIASAARQGMRHLEALASELHGQFWLDRGKPDFALIYLLRARNLHAALGAMRKVRALERRHPGITEAGAQLRITGTGTGTTASEVLDVTAIAKATRAISGELELDKLLERMLDIIFEDAGADGGALVLESPAGLAVAASRTAGAPRSSTTSVPLTSAVLPRALVHYVHRTDATVVLDDATSDVRFGNDDYIRTHAPKAVLCMPVKHQDRMMGVLYLENTLVSRAFTQARLDALTILVSQLAVSLENAMLFAAQRVQAEAISHANDELRSEITVREQAERELARYRSHLEDLIAERTQELTHANQRLRDAAAERERIEAELRLAQKLESVGRLAAGIAHEINTPIQFVSDNLTFVRDILPGLFDTLASYRDLAVAADAYDGLATATATARAAEEAGDVDYALSNTPSALAAALDGLGRVAAIVRSMKVFAHPDRDEKTMVDLNQAIESTLVIAANECKFVADVHTDLAPLPLVRCNGGEINQAILNLVINAAHAIRDVVGQSGAKGQIAIGTRHDGNDVEIEIRDTGTGIPIAIRHKIYDPFFTTKEVGRGTGQGLAIVHSVVVDKHGGTLRFETETGIGTRFFLRLPIDQGE
jgi:signal transduction histidine kinase